MPRCTKCLEDKDESEFHLRGGGKRHKQCAVCKRAAIKAAYEANKPKYIARAKASNDKIRTEIRKLIRDGKKKPCADCGKRYPTCVMDYDHLPGQRKLENVANLPASGSVSKVRDEIAKCEVVCSNCHRLRTRKRLRAERKKKKSENGVAK